MFQRGPNPIWFENNLVGQPFDSASWAFFLTNDLPYIPQAVYVTPNGIPWANPLEFSPNGGLPNNLYFDPSLVYRIEFRQGPTQNDPLIGNPVENYQVGSGEITPVLNPLTTGENMITNPQFADILFSSPVTFTTAGTYDISQGWQLVLAGSGSITVTRNVNAGNANITGSPAYYLTFDSSGWSSVQLIQKFSNNGSIFNLGAIAVAFSAFATSAIEHIAVNYTPSTGASILIKNFVIQVGSFQSFVWAVDLITSTNSDTNGNAFVDIVFTLPVSGIVSISNIQITGQSNPLSSNFDPNSNSPPYAELTYERMVDHEFNVYRDSLVQQPKSSILAGWNFSLNPWQFTTIASTNVAANQYTADQTIVIQQAYVTSDTTGNNVAAGRGTLADNYGFTVTAVTAHNQFALLQYIDPATVRPYWNKVLSSLAKLKLESSHGTSIKLKVRLIYKAGLPETVDRTHPVASWAEGSDPALFADWSFIMAENDPVYTLTANNDNYSFDGFQLPVSTNSAMTLGIMIYTISNMNQTATSDAIVFDNISLVHNDFAIEAQAETFDEALRKCQYYYEKSYDTGVLPGTTSSFASSSVAQNASNTTIVPNLQRNFKVSKRSTPELTWYSPNSGLAAGNAGSIYNFSTNADTTIASTVNLGINSTGYPNGDGDVDDAATVYGHWIADSRLGT